MPNVSTLKLNNDVEMPALGLGVFQTPPSPSRGRSSDFFRLPAHRHGSCLRQQAAGRRSGAQFWAGPI